jgi:hypothetical protein
VSELAGRDYFTVEQAADYACISHSHWRARISRKFPPGTFFGKQIYRRTDVERWLEARPRRAMQSTGAHAAASALSRARALHAVPPWADLQAIAAIYAECRRITLETGVEHHVDHIAPLIGVNACGLHVEYNLQIITKAANLLKGNR